jgi:hypothetical protein
MKHKILFAAAMGTITTGVVSLTLVFVNKGFTNGFFAVWLKSWLIAYLVAVPTILLFGPRVQVILNKLVKVETGK